MDPSVYTPIINDINIIHVREQIAAKVAGVRCNGTFGPFRPTMEQGSAVLTDYDTFPYPRWWRGIASSTMPIIAEREAGWRPRHDDCYSISQQPQQVETFSYPENCFESASKTIYPCRPNLDQGQRANQQLETALNTDCIIKYR